MPTNTVIRWDPVNEVVSLRDAMDRLFEDSFIQPRFFAPLREGFGQLPLDVVENDNDIVVKASVPGIKPDELDITIVGDTLTIKGESRPRPRKRRTTTWSASAAGVRSSAH